MITDQEREKALGLLARSRQTLLDAVEGVTEDQASWKPAADRWSIIEYVEHLAISDDGLIALIKGSLATPARPETEDQRRAREAKIRDTPVPRGANHAPEMLRPNQRFASLSEAVAAFLAARERTILIRSQHPGRFAKPLFRTQRARSTGWIPMAGGQRTARRNPRRTHPRITRLA
jgi:DinB family protein